MPNIAYLPHYLTKDDILLVQDEMIRLQQGERGGLKLEKLHGHDVYSIHINKVGRAARLLLIKKQGQWVAVEIVLNHDYHKAKCLKPQVLSQLLGVPCSEINFMWETTDNEVCVADFTEVAWVSAYLQGHKPILLDDNQSETLSLVQPGLIIGPPGSGKTSVSMAILQQFILQTDLEKPAVVYIVPTPELKSQLETLWSLNPLAEKACVTFKVYADLIPANTAAMITDAQFQTWITAVSKTLKKYAEVIKALSLKSGEMRFEFSLIKAMGNDAYQKAGMDECCFYEQKQLLQQLYKSYKAYLGQEALIDLYLSEIDVPVLYDLTLIDEGQSFFPFQHLELTKLSAHNNALYLCVDTEQCIKTARLIEGFIQQNYYHHQRRLNPHKLTHTYRCPEAVVRLVNALMGFGGDREPPKSSHHYTAMVSMVPYAGDARYYSCIDDSNSDFLHALCDSPDTLMIVQDMASKSSCPLKTALTLTPSQAIGFDAETVILIDPFNTPEAKSFARRTSANPPTLKEWAWFRALFVAFTRAAHRLVIIQPDNHDVEAILTTLKSLCGSGQSLSPIAAENSAEKWIKRYQQAYALGHVSIADEIRQQHPEIQFPAALPVVTEAPASDNKPEVKVAVAKIPNLTEKQVLTWCQSGVAEIKKQWGVGYKNLLPWLQDAKNIMVFTAIVSKNNLFREQLKQLLWMHPPFLYELIKTPSGCRLLENLVAPMSSSELNKIKKLLEGDKLDDLLFRIQPDIFVRFFHELADEAWFTRLTQCKPQGRLLHVIEMNEANLLRCAKVINQGNRWVWLGDDYLKDMTSSKTPLLIMLLERVNQKAWAPYKEDLITIAVAILAENPKSYLKLFTLHERQVCLLSLMIDYFLKIELASPPYVLFVSMLKQTFINEDTRDAFILALTKGIYPQEGVNVLSKFFTSMIGHSILTQFIVDIPDFKAVLVKMMAEVSDIEILGHVASEQLNHLIHHESRPVDELLIKQYQFIMMFFKDKIVDTDIQKGLVFYPSSEHKGAIETHLNGVESKIIKVLGSSGIESRDYPGLFGEFNRLRYVILDVLFSDCILARDDALKVMGILFAALLFCRPSSSPCIVEYIVCEGTSAIVVNRTLFVDRYNAKGYQDALILDEDFNLNHFHYLSLNHPFKQSIVSGQPNAIKSCHRMLDLAFKLRGLEGFSPSNPADWAACYRHISEYILFPLLFTEAIPKIELLTHGFEYSDIGIRTLFEMQSFQTVKQVMLLAPYHGTSLFEYRLSHDKGEAFIALLKEDDCRLKLFMLLKACGLTKEKESVPVYEILLASKAGMMLLCAMMESFVKDKAQALEVFSEWLYYVYTPNTIHDDAHTPAPGILFHRLVANIARYDIANEHLIAFCKLISEHVTSWQFAMPSADKDGVTPLIYTLLQPKISALDLISHQTWEKIYGCIAKFNKLLNIPFNDEQGLQTTILREMLIYRDNQQFFRYINCMSDEFKDVLYQALLTDRIHPNQLTTIAALRASLLGYLIHCSDMSMALYTIHTEYPEVFASLIRALSAEQADSPFKQFMQKTVYSRQLLRIFGLDNSETYLLSIPVFKQYIELIALVPPKNLCEQIPLMSNCYGLREASINQCMSELNTFEETKDWDWDFFNHEATLLMQLRAQLSESFSNINKLTTRENSHAVRGVILAYALSRHVMPYSLDIEIKLVHFDREEWMVLIHPVFSHEDMKTANHQSYLSLAYSINENKVLADQEVNDFINSKSSANKGMLCVWSSLTGSNYLRYFLQEQIKHHANNPKLKSVLERCLTEVNFDVFFGKQLDTIDNINNSIRESKPTRLKRFNSIFDNINIKYDKEAKLVTMDLK